MPELTSRITNADNAAQTAASTAHTDSTDVLAAIQDLRHWLGADSDVTQADVRNAIVDFSDRMATLIEGTNNKLQNLLDFLDIMNTNAAKNAQLTIGGLNAISCCDVTLSPTEYGAPDSNSCARAGWGRDIIYNIVGQLYAMRQAGNSITQAYIQKLYAYYFPSDAILYTAPSDYAWGVAGASNGLSDTAIGDLWTNLGAGLGDAIRNVIANSSTASDAKIALDVLYNDYDFSTEQKLLLRNIYQHILISDIYSASFDFSTYDNGACAPVITIPSCTGATSIFSRTLSGSTLLGFASGSSLSSVFWTCPTLALDFELTIVNHDDGDSVVGSFHQGEAFDLEGATDYRFRPTDGVTSGEHTFTACITPYE